MEFKTKLYFNSCDGQSPFDSNKYVISVLTEDGDKINCNVDYNIYEFFMKKQKFFALENITFSLYKYTKGEKAGAYAIVPDLKACIGANYGK